MDDRARADESGSTTRWTRRPVVVVGLGGALFLGSAALGSVLMHGSRSAVAVQSSVVLLAGIALALAIVGGIVHAMGQWHLPLRRLREKLRQVHEGEAPIEELDQVHGQLAGLVPTLRRILGDLKQLRAQVSRLEGETRQRVEQRTDALQRTIGSLRQQAIKDPLTGLYNRRMFDQSIDPVVQRCREGGSDLCALTMDLDNFKFLNDSLGHAAGDELLRAVGQIIRSAIRDHDLAFRCGGDEFVILMPGSPEKAGEALAQRLSSLVDALGKTHRLAYPPRLSIGVVGLCASGLADGATLLAEGDRRLYAQKAARKDQRARASAGPAA
jgi:diguanylate cyclase (GGDEF)-like protein